MICQVCRHPNEADREYFDLLELFAFAGTEPLGAPQLGVAGRAEAGSPGFG